MKKTINGISYNSQREFVSNLNKISKAGERYQAPGRDTTYTFYTTKMGCQSTQCTFESFRSSKITP